MVGPVTPSTPAATRRSPAIAIVAVVMPLIAIGIAAVVTTSTSDDRGATATTLSQAGDPAREREGTRADGADRSGDPTTTAAAGDRSTSTTSTTTAAREEPETPSRPADAGTEAERTSATYPQPTVPPGGCSRPGGTATITLTSSPSPSCLRLGADQPVVVRNRTGREITFVAVSVNEVLAPGTETRIGSASSAFGGGRSTFWSPGNPALSGIVIVS